MTWIDFHFESFKWRQAAERSQVFWLSMIRGPRVLVHLTAVIITFLLIMFKRDAGGDLLQILDTRYV